MFWQKHDIFPWVGKRNFVCKIACAMLGNVVYYTIKIFCCSGRKTIRRSLVYE